MSLQQPNSSPLFFWGHKGNSPNKCLSNWYPASFVDEDNKQFVNTEQYMMYHKAILFNDNVTGEEILNLSNPNLIKKKGRQVKNFVESIWQENALIIVYNGCLLKFSQNESLKKYLLSTGDRLLVEASPYDKIWGIGMDEKTALKTSPDKWRGTNWLGECLIKVRKTLREREKK